MGLTIYISRRGIVLSVQRIELLVESVFRGDAGVDGTADGPDRRSLHDRAFASNRSSLSLRPKKARTVPFGSGDRECDLGETVIGLAIPGKTVSRHHYPLRSTIPLSYQHSSRC